MSLQRTSLPPAFKDYALHETDAQITGKVPAMKHYFYSLSLYQCMNMTIKKCHLHLARKVIFCLSEMDEKVLYEYAKTVVAIGDNTTLLL